MEVPARVDTRLRVKGCRDACLRCRNRTDNATYAPCYGVIEPKLSAAEPTVKEWHGHLAEIVLLENVLVPNDELDDAETVRER